MVGRDRLDWRVKGELDAICEKHYKPGDFLYKRQKRRYTLEEILDAAHRYEASLAHNQLSFMRVLVPALYFHCHLSLKEISAVVNRDNVWGWIDRFKPFLLDPHYNPSPRVKIVKHPALLGLTVKEAAKALGCSEMTIYNYFDTDKVQGLFTRMALDMIFVFDMPPQELIDAAREKDMNKIRKNFNKQKKYLIGD